MQKFGFLFFHKAFCKSFRRLLIFRLDLYFFLSFICNLGMSLNSDLFFSRLAKYLRFLSLYSTMLAFDLRIDPFILFSIMFSNSLTFCSKFALMISIILTFVVSAISFFSLFMSLFSSSSSLLVSFVFFDAYSIVSFLTVLFSSSQREFEFASGLILVFHQ